MADGLDSDTYVGSKRRISELSETEEGKQGAVAEPHSNPLFSPRQQSPDIVSAAKEEGSETVLNMSDCGSELSNFLQKKVKCSSSDESVVQENQETVRCKLVMVSEGDIEAQEGLVFKFLNENKQDLEKYEMGMSGIQEFCEIEKGSTSRLSMDFTSIEEAQSVKEVLMCSAVEDFNKGLGDSCIASDESESLFKNKEKQILVKHGLESISDAETHSVKFADIGDNAEIINVKEVSDHSSDIGEMLGVIGNKGTYEKKSVLEGDAGDSRCAMKIEIFDDIALIETGSASRVGNGCGKERGFVGFANHPERYGVKKNMKQETDGKKEKRGRRKGKAWKKCLGTNGNGKVFANVDETQKGCEKKGEGSKRVYSRKEMETMRFGNVEEQRKKWIEVYCGLGTAVGREYDGLVDCNHQKQVHFDPRQYYRRNDAGPSILGEECSEKLDYVIESTDLLDPACGLSGSDVAICTVAEEECSYDDDSDAEYSSIQRPAFLVTGEPDFDSGPPQDGLEYLRRVRWEAKQIPKVKVAKAEVSKLNKEQTVYMPQIPDIAKCPEHLMPLKQWEDTFLVDFSELRLALSHHEEECSHQLLESIILEKFDNLTTDGVDSCQSIDSIRSFSTVDESDAPLSLSSPKCFIKGGSGNCPTLSTILGMDSVGRVSMLRKHINSVETMSSLSRNDCAWLFALCAAVDTPLDADTCAALRCLLRKCASLRAEKSELDDEVVMLNILATISGKYFGQSEN